MCLNCRKSFLIILECTSFNKTISAADLKLFVKIYRLKNDKKRFTINFEINLSKFVPN